MRLPRSLAGRLLLGSAVTTLLVLAAVLVLMQLALTRFVRGQVDQRLDNKLVALASQLRVDGEGMLRLAGEADGPPFDDPRHRSFWIAVGPRNGLRTAWLRDADAPSAAVIEEALAGPAPPGRGFGVLDAHPRTLLGSALGEAMYARVVRTRVDGTPIILLAAAPREAITHPVGEAMLRVGGGVVLLGLVLAGLAAAQVRLGLRPLERLRAEVAAISDGRRSQLTPEQPDELRPLVGEMNVLLKQQAANLERARRNVANLAHGLKTPLATLRLRLARLEGGDGADRAALIALLDACDGRVRHHLARARAAALDGPQRARTELAPRLADIADALRRIHDGCDIVIAVPDGLALACEGGDVDEIFGNLLDNAAKFARERVRAAASPEGRQIVVTIADDGPGLSAAEAALALQPGRRLDEAVPGHGFGLTIARELVELYGGELRLASGDRGLTATVRLPSA